MKLDFRGKIIVMSDGKARLLLVRPDGATFSETVPADAKFWDKDSNVFMMELLAFQQENNLFPTQRIHLSTLWQ